MSQQLTDRQQLADEYRRWLNANAPAKVGRDAWLAKWRLWRQTQDEIDRMLVGVALATEQAEAPAAELCSRDQLLRDAAEWVEWAANHCPDAGDRMAAQHVWEQIDAELEA